MKNNCSVGLSQVKTPLIVQAKGKMVNIPFPRVQEEKPWVMSESHLAGGVKAVKKSGNTI